MFVDRIGVAEINQWFADRGEAISTRKSNLGRLGSMFDVPGAADTSQRILA
jgi:hypothetical protein